MVKLLGAVVFCKRFYPDEETETPQNIEFLAKYSLDVEANTQNLN